MKEQLSRSASPTRSKPSHRQALNRDQAPVGRFSPWRQSGSQVHCAAPIPGAQSEGDGGNSSGGNHAEMDASDVGNGSGRLVDSRHGGNPAGRWPGNEKERREEQEQASEGEVTLRSARGEGSDHSRGRRVRRA